MPGITMAMTSIASANAAMAAQEAREARLYYCKTLMNNPMLDSIKQKQDFADCVFFLWPSEPDHGIFYIKCGVAALFAGAILGGFLNQYDRILGILAGLSLALVADIVALLLSFIIFA